MKKQYIFPINPIHFPHVDLTKTKTVLIRQLTNFLKNDRFVLGALFENVFSPKGAQTNSQNGVYGV